MSPWSLVLHAAALAALAGFPLVGGAFHVEELAVRLMIFAIFAISLDLLVGYTGLVSLGHAAFFGLGAYGLALLTPDGDGAALWLAAPVAIAIAAVAALAIGALSVRTGGIYFIMITLAFAQMLFYFAIESADFGGSDGLFVLARPAADVFGIATVDLNDPTTFYYAVLASLVACYLLLAMLLRAPFGQVIQAIRANEPRVRALGFPTVRYKLASFVIAGAVAGYAGFLQAAHAGYVSPGLMSWHQSGIVLMVVILGGMGTLWGPVLGTFAFLLLEDQLQTVTDHSGLWIGLFIIALVLVLPQGLAGLAGRLRRRPAVGAKSGGDGA